MVAERFSITAHGTPATCGEGLRHPLPHPRHHARPRGARRRRGHAQKDCRDFSSLNARPGCSGHHHPDVDQSRHHRSEVRGDLPPGRAGHLFPPPARGRPQPFAPAAKHLGQCGRSRSPLASRNAAAEVDGRKWRAAEFLGARPLPVVPSDRIGPARGPSRRGLSQCSRQK